MCGICGIVDWLGRPIDTDQALRMRDVMRTRGPDDAGLHTEPGVALGHRRLSIIDLSAAGHQPMTNEDQTVHIVFNGEIYNFLELRAQLVAAGHRFRSHTDSEVLIHGYEQWGLENLVPRLRGMFAIALWDRTKRQLHLVRDHLGKKPLFYQCQGGRILFASDIKSIWLAQDRTPDLNEQALDEFLYYSVITQQHTIFRGVNKLPPAHWATFTADSVSGTAARLVQYWRPDPTRKAAASTEQWLEGVDHYLRQAVKRRLISDVPLGGFLSGGVDSSTVCALMAQEGGRPRTFSVGFSDQKRFDERQYSRTVARHIGSDHTELLVEPDVAPILSELVWQYGEPYGDSSMIPTYLIAREARKFVTVVLTGDGGDEAFAGYSRHLRADRARRYHWLGPARQAAVGGAHLISALFGSSRFARDLLLGSRYLAGDPCAPISDLCWFDSYRKKLYSPAFRRRLGNVHPLQSQRQLLGSHRGPTELDRAMETLLQTTLPNDYLVKVDVATMAHSLEARCPLLDVDLLDFALTIPSSVLVEGNVAKSLLKKYAARLIPPEVVYRKKHGFSVPVRHWFRQEWREGTARLLLSKTALDRGLFNPAFVRNILNEHVAGTRDHGARIWTMLVLELWHQLFVDRTLKPGQPVFA